MTEVSGSGVRAGGPQRYRRMYFYTPTFSPVGGVLKIFDYVNHARGLGYEPMICCPEDYDAGLPLFQISRFSSITPENGVCFTGLDRVTVGPDELAFLSWPTHYQIVEPRMSRWTKHEQIIYIVQNVRWANPHWIHGYALRLLSRPMARIMTIDPIYEAIKPYLNPTSMSEVIRIGHDAAFFSKSRSGGLSEPVKVGYTTWKSNVGDQIARLLPESGFEFRAIRNPVGWRELRELYHWSDVFLATPLAEEGMYLPGLEAMAAGAIVISPDAGGNREYCRFGENCLYARFADAGSYAEVLRSLRSAGAEKVEALRRAGYETVGHYTLEREAERFGEFMRRLTERLESAEERS